MVGSLHSRKREAHDVVYVSVAQLARRYNVVRSTIWRWVSRGELPPPVKFSDQVTRWRLDEIERHDAERAGKRKRRKAS
jgi:predicted DNA-binding transcriptional regulator AlpA